jgi:hypothetical protein
VIILGAISAKLGIPQLTIIMNLVKKNAKSAANKEIASKFIRN